MSEIDLPSSGQGGYDFFGLNRPQYTSTPEMLLSSLAWEAAEHLQEDLEKEYDGLVYRRVVGAKKPQRKILESAPQPDTDEWRRLEESLDSEFSFVESESGNRASHVFVDMLVGNVPAKAQSETVVPLNVVTALMQDSRGMMGVNNPPNFSGILERMYNLGGGSGRAAFKLARAYQEMSPSRGEQWFEHATNAMAPAQISRLAGKFIDFEGFGHVSHGAAETVPAWLLNGRTPFHWFATAWDSLADHAWASKMPRRRWVDWASCLLRTVMGCGYLFEMNFYYGLVLALKNDRDEEEVVRELIGKGGQIILWDNFSSISSRDVAGHIRKICQRGTACRKLLVNDWPRVFHRSFPKIAKHSNQKDGLAVWLREVRVWLNQGDSEEKSREIRQAISGSTSGTSSKNIYETVSYTLLDRGTLGVSEDLYSLFKKRGRRYTIVEPGQEWLVVISSLLAENSGGLTRLADVKDAVESLGIKVGIKTLIRDLERAGLARTSHDADDAIEVVAAF